MSGTNEPVTLLNSAPAPAAPAAPAPVPAAPAAPVSPQDSLFPAKPAEAPAAPAAAEPTKPAEEPKPAAPVVPEVYEFKAPEGVKLDPAQLEAFTPIAKELGLSNEQAQRLVDLNTANVQAARTAQESAWKAVNKTWREETRADKDIGGAKYDENIGVASKAIDKFGTPELRKALDESGMGNHPAVVKFFVNVGRQLSEDTMASGNAGQGGGAPKTAAQMLYPNLK